MLDLILNCDLEHSSTVRRFHDSLKIFQISSFKGLLRDSVMLLTFKSGIP